MLQMKLINICESAERRFVTKALKSYHYAHFVIEQQRSRNIKETGIIIIIIIFKG